MRTFPYLIARIGGDSFDLFTCSYTTQLSELIQKIEDLDHEIDKQKSAISDILFAYINTLTDSKQQNALLNIRRDIFNGRRIKTQLIADVTSFAEEPMIRVTAFVDLNAQREQLLENLAKCFNEAKAEIRTTIGDLASRDSLQNGLLFSSRSLLQTILHYNERSKTEDIAWSTERGLLKYLSRIYTKTSPFSSFTSLAVAKLSDNGNSKDSLIDAYLDSSSVKSDLRINNSVFQILKSILFQRPEFYGHLNIRSNPTIVKDRQRLKFLVNRHNVESFQYLERNAVLDLIYEILKNRTSDLTFNEFVKEIQEEIDSSDEELSTYVYNLCECGYIEINLNISGLSADWDTHLIDLLNKSKIDRAKVEPLVEMLSELNGIRRKYPDLPIHERRNTLNGLVETIENGIYSGQPQTQNRATMGLKEEHVFYEDTSRVGDITVSKEKIDYIFNKLNTLLDPLMFLDGYFSEAERMKIYFCSRYKAGKKLSVLKFYEDYYRDFKFLDDKLNDRYNPIKEDERQKIVEDRKYSKYLKLISDDGGRKERFRSIALWRNRFAELLPTNSPDTINITASLIKRSLDGLTIKIPSKFNYGVNHGAFAQFYTSGETLKAVIASSGPGFGRMMGRFMHLFNPEMTTSLREWNDQHKKDAILVEGVDASLFNANIHPPLLEREIWMPGGNNGLPRDQQISVSDLIIEYNAHIDELELKDKKNNKSVFVLDLGFQGDAGRSKLYQLLTRFTLSPTYGVHSVWTMIHEILRMKIKPQGGMLTLPRVVYEDDIILSRKRWELQPSGFPLKKNGEGDTEYFLRINQWRKNHKMPTEVFVSLNPYRATTGKDTKISKDDYKPQYINFLWPQFVQLFATMLDREPNLVSIEEMTPSSNEMLTLGGRPYVTEFVVNWTSLDGMA